MNLPLIKRIGILQSAIDEYATLTERVQRQIADLSGIGVYPPVRAPGLTSTEAKMLVVIDQMLHYTGHGEPIPAETIALARRISDDLHMALRATGPCEKKETQNG